MSGEVQKWADDFMFRSESHDASTGPRVHLLAMPSDPLGQIAACAKMYKGEVVRSLADVTDDERRYYMREMQKTRLKMPLESVTFHFMIENVTRAFTHQLVRQRTAAYAQESMRFAVVEDMTEAVALPPSLARYNDPQMQQHVHAAAAQVGYDHLSESDQQFLKWEQTVKVISGNYNDLVNSGMPAEDARGLMPTNIVTRINYITNLRGLLDHAGNRLCTQAQFEWRLVFSQIAKAIREYDPRRSNAVRLYDENPDAWEHPLPDAWQFDALADLFRPICYATGKCEFGAEFDRKCSIRSRVQANAAINRPSTEWHEGLTLPHTEDGKGGLHLDPINPAEWLTDPAAAR